MVLPTALGGAIFGATLGSWVAWAADGAPLPSQPAADAIAHAVVGMKPVWQQRFDFAFGDDGYDDGAPGRVDYRYGRSIALGPALEALRAGGWSVAADRSEAVKGDYRLTIRGDRLRIERAEPSGLAWLTAIGALLGAYGGWMLTARMGRLLARQSVAIKAAVAVIAVIAMWTLLPSAFFSALQLVRGDGAPWAMLYWEPFRIVALVGATCALVAVALTEWACGRKVLSKKPGRVAH
ncbi:hypothetical protein [Allorhizocola rhizosphaerae]|uniref:hypothetical protein n=1 Tax=Allorhizocola rhizosphaerae TaxID=1872709 RepID=UPI000E3C89F0|nr:hypothetical protein [Allorhizocola rhizosphaerae]